MVETSTEAIQEINKKFLDKEIKSIYIRIAPGKKPVVRVQTRNREFWQLYRKEKKGLLEWKILDPGKI
jgi:hypothetical protein